MIAPDPVLDQTFDPANLLQTWRKYAPDLRDAPDSVLLAAAELCKRHDLNPFSGQEIRIYKSSGDDTWVTVVALDVLRRSAQNQSLYSLVPRELTTDELREIRRNIFHPDDIGWEVSLYRLDVAQQCRSAGVPYFPTVKVGLWRNKAEKMTDVFRAEISWTADEVPNGRQRSDVAKRRAERAALMEAYPLALGGDKSSASIVSWLKNILAREGQNRAIMAPRPAMLRDEDDVLHYAE
jgi:hypothetical protein